MAFPEDSQCRCLGIYSDEAGRGLVGAMWGEAQVARFTLIFLFS